MTDLTKQDSAAPTRKTTAAMIGAALSTIVAWSARQFGHVEIPAEVAVAGATVFTILCAYMTHERAD